MAPAGKNTTPGRRKRTDNQFFDVGKVGRKTGVTLPDTGLRDENGLEPVSGIFSSPDQNGDRTLTSEGMDVQESSAPDVTATLTHRKTPRLPPPRQSTPKHTNIGSPKRMSSVKRSPRKDEDDDDLETRTQPPANRRLDFGATNRNRKSISVIDTRSPFKPKKVLRRSTGPGRADPFDVPDDDADAPVPHPHAHHTPNGVEDDEVEPSIEGDDAPISHDDETSYAVDIEHNVAEAEPQEETEARAASASPPKRKRGRPRKSDQSLNNSQIDTSAKKRGRPSLDQSETIEDVEASTAQGDMAPPAKRQRISNEGHVTIHHDEGTEVVDPGSIAYGDEYIADGNLEEAQEESNPDAQAQLDSQLAEEQPEQSKKGKGRGKGKKGKAAEPKDRSSNPAAKKGSPVKLNDSPSKLQRGGSAGPVSNVNLRATTPFEDAGQQTSRFGRNLIQPLKFWENESLIWKAGEIEGIVRAEHVEKTKPKKSKRKKGRKARLDDIDEESETESTMADEWEDTVGVISGQVAQWDAAAKAGDSDKPVEEDLAFSVSSIITRDVAGSAFKYAKIMTIPFFGAGVVELPPEGFKRAKNSRKMQMVFFVHEGKVMVEVGATGLEVNKFALSKGGVWVVPRGNNYAISNESRTRDAKIFFAQGCEVASAAE